MNDKPPLLLSFPEEIWAYIFTFLPCTSKSKQQEESEKSLRCTCKQLHQLLQSENYYQAKVMGAYASNKRVSSSEWPSHQRVGKWRILNQILSKYAILEGFWVICDAWPFGYLILCRFHGEKFCGDIIYPLPTVIGKDNRRQRNVIRYRNLTERIFEISFADDTGEESCKVLSSQTAAHFGIQEEESVILNNLRFPRNRGLLFEISDISEANYKDDENEGIITADGDTMPPIKSLISDMINDEHRFLMEYLDGPNGRPISDATAYQKIMKESIQIDSNMPLIKPGLYVGSYGTQYGFRQHEIIQIRYFEISEDNGKSQQDERQVLLDDAFGGRIPSDFSTKEELTTFLISGRKVTGDTHVPTGEVTWVANMSKTIEDTSDRPEFVLDHNRQRHNVKRAWPGYGTLAYLFFQRPSWNDGWLYQLEDDEYDGSSRFAFAWSKWQNEECIILNGLPNYCDSRF